MGENKWEPEEGTEVENETFSVTNSTVHGKVE